MLERVVADPSLGRLVVIRAAGSAAGYALIAFGFSLEYGGRDAFVDEIYLRAEYRGRGWGRRLLEFVEHETKRCGVGALHLEVARENAVALALYRQFGFDDHDRYLMTKQVAPESDSNGLCPK
jgi:ribosomal protein S18 acetylase RimI-like enzyme